MAISQHELSDATLLPSEFFDALIKGDSPVNVNASLRLARFFLGFLLILDEFAIALGFVPSPM